MHKRVTSSHNLGKPNGANQFIWSRDGKELIVFKEQQNTVRVFDVGSGQLLRTVALNGPRADNGLPWSPDGTKWVSWNGCSVHIWDANTGSLLHELKHIGSVRQVTWSPDGRTLLSGAGHPAGSNWDSKIVQWDVATGDPIRTIDTGTAAVKGVAYSPNGRTIWAIGTGPLRQWDAETGRPLATVLPIKDNRFAIISPEGHYAGSPDIEDELLYVALTDEGQYLTFTPKEFAEKYGWKNDPARVHMPGEYLSDTTPSVEVEAAER